MTTETDHDADEATEPKDGPRPEVSEAARAAARPAPSTGARRTGSVAPRRAPTPEANRRASDPKPATPARTSRLPWVLAALGLVGTLVFGGLWLSARGDDAGSATATTGAAADVEAAANRFAKALTNFDGATIDANVDQIVALSTGDFQDEVDQFFSSDTRKQLKEASASSRGEIRSSYVQGIDGDRGSAFVVLDQTIANDRSPQPKADTLRMEVALREVDGEWLVQRVNVLDAPSGTYSGAAAAGDEPASTTVPGG